MRLWIAGSAVPRPAAGRVAYVDGRADGAFREGVDVELSHRFGNRTPRQFRGDTATAICLRFVESGGKADLAVNDHVDVDGVLALFTLLEPELALGHRRTWGARFAHYEIPFALSSPAAMRVPSLGEPFSEACVLWPQVRSRLDRERIVLVTVGVKAGWAHELWYPGYCWADAPQSWRPPG